MKWNKLIIYSLLVGILAGFVTLLTDVLQSAGFIATGASLTFVTFCCWATYFLYGASPQNALKAWASMIPGIICAIIIYVACGVFVDMGMNFAYLALPLAVVVGVVLMCLCEKLPYINNVAAIFIGAGLFFGLMGTPAAGETGYFMVAIGELAYAAIGLVAGYLTIKIANVVNPTK